MKFDQWFNKALIQKDVAKTNTFFNSCAHTVLATVAFLLLPNTNFFHKEALLTTCTYMTAPY